MNGTTTILDGARLLMRHGGVAEVRILTDTWNRTVAGWFESPETLAGAVTEWDGRATVYITLNPVTPDLLARVNNRLQPKMQDTTKDADILYRAWLPVDLDPVRPAGIPSSDAELALALERRDAVVAYLAERGFPAPVVAMSGNGGHLLYAINLPNDEAATALVKQCLAALAARFDDGRVRVDTANYNAARVWKLYGTISCKGDETPERPQRRAIVEGSPW